VPAAGLDAECVAIGDLPTRALQVARTDEDLVNALTRMRFAGVRRVPVVDAEGALAGILTAGDRAGPRGATAPRARHRRAARGRVAAAGAEPVCGIAPATRDRRAMLRS